MEECNFTFIPHWCSIDEARMPKLIDEFVGREADIPSIGTSYYHAADLYSVVADIVS